jgi:peptidoglycan hydrolase-like protein with peptidoglycan-binding domain
MRPYVVRQGDYLGKLAHRYGFDADEVWNLSDNDKLRQARPNPNILCPGDILYIPESPGRELQATSGTTNQYKASLPTTKVTITLRDRQGAIANIGYIVEGLAKPIEGTTDGDGVAKFSVPIHVRAVDLVLRGEHHNTRYLVRIGHMDPIEERSGQRARLAHLGYLRAPHAEVDTDEDPRLEHALRTFQRAQGLPESGAADSATLSALADAHGS